MWRFKLVLLGSYLVVLSSMGCESKKVRPKNPAVEIMATPDHTIDNEHVSDFELYFDDQKFGVGTVELREGDEFVLSGSYRIDESKFQGRILFQSTNIRWLPKGASDEDWNHANRTWEFSTRQTAHLPKAPTFKMETSPGMYDVRAFMRIQGEHDDLPIYVLVQRGTVQVLPKES